jgi:hypothetical protein
LHEAESNNTKNDELLSMEVTNLEDHSIIDFGKDAPLGAPILD